MVGGSGDRSEDISCLCNLGYNIDGNNMPDPEKKLNFLDFTLHNFAKCCWGDIYKHIFMWHKCVKVKVTDRKFESMAH